MENLYYNYLQQYEKYLYPPKPDENPSSFETILTRVGLHSTHDLTRISFSQYNPTHQLPLELFLIGVAELG